MVEIMVVRCHQIAADVYERDEGVHRHRKHNEWTSQAMLRVPWGSRPFIRYHCFCVSTSCMQWVSLSLTVESMTRR